MKNNPITKPHRHFVKLDMRRLTITVNVKNAYEIELERCVSTGEILDFILQVAGKGWCTPQVLAELVDAFEEASRKVFDCALQGAACPSGYNMKLDWRKGTYNRQHR